MLNLTVDFGSVRDPLVAGTIYKYTGAGTGAGLRRFPERARPGGGNNQPRRVFIKLRYMSRHSIKLLLLSNPNVVWLRRGGFGHMDLKPRPLRSREWRDKKRYLWFIPYRPDGLLR